MSSNTLPDVHDQAIFKFYTDLATFNVQLAKYHTKLVQDPESRVLALTPINFGKRPCPTGTFTEWARDLQVFLDNNEEYQKQYEDLKKLYHKLTLRETQPTKCPYFYYFDSILNSRIQTKQKESSNITVEAPASNHENFQNFVSPRLS